jgi:hypothetical protein
VTSKLSLMNGALKKLKQRKLDSLTVDEAARYALDDEYDKCLAFMLEAGLWNHASRSVELEESTDVEPSFGYTYAFEKPDDYVKLIAISPNQDLWPTLDSYLDEGGVWNAYCSPLYIQYVSNHTSYGMDLSLWPASFVDAVEYNLAVRVAPEVTAMGTGEFDKLQSDAMKALNTARSRDAMNQAVERPPPGRLVRSRMGRGGSSGTPYWRR